MSIWKKLFGSGTSSGDAKKVYKSSDNMGTTYTDYNKVNAAWQAQGMMLAKGNRITINFDNGTSKEVISKGHPYICYTFSTEEAARKGLSSVSFIKTASDTNAFISLEILEFGYYETETPGKWEAIIWGENLTVEMFEESKNKFSEAGGLKKGERIPEKRSEIKPKASKATGKASYVRTDVNGPNTYVIHKAPSKLAALDFLKNTSVTKSLYYVIVETPEGNWGKDIDGIYQE